MFIFTRCYYEKRDVFENTRRGIKGENHVVYLLRSELTVLDVLHESEIISPIKQLLKTNSRIDERVKCVTMIQYHNPGIRTTWAQRLIQLNGTRPSKLSERKSLTAIMLQGFHIPIGGVVIRKIHHKRRGTTDGNDCSIPGDRYILSCPRNVAV